MKSSNHAFFESLTRCFQIFNADWIWIEKKNFECEDHDYSAPSSLRISRYRCEDHDYSASSSRYEYIKHTSSEISAAKHLCYLKKLRCVRENACKKLRIQDLRNEFRLRDWFVKNSDQIRNIKSIISWDQQFRYINRISATTTIALIFTHMR